MTNHNIKGESISPVSPDLGSGFSIYVGDDDENNQNKCSENCKEETGRRKRISNELQRMLTEHLTPVGKRKSATHQELDEAWSRHIDECCSSSLPANPSPRNEASPNDARHAKDQKGKSPLFEAPGTRSVRNLPWSDDSGKSGLYTGEVNKNSRPHGWGVLVYDNQRWHASIWDNGLAVEPQDTKKNSRSNRSTYVHTGCSSITMDAEMPNLRSSRTSSIGSSVCSTYIPKLDLGDVGSPQDMMLTVSHTSEIECLQRHDFAFVRRTTGQYTYAIIAQIQQNSILFVVDSRGSIKRVDRNLWLKRIKLVNTARNKQKVDSVIESAVRFSLPAVSKCASEGLSASPIRPRRLSARRRSSSCDREQRQSLTRRSGSSSSNNPKLLNRKESVLSLFD